MDRLTARKVRYYIGLHYPLFVTLTDEGFSGHYPDLPGCVAVASDCAELYAAMDQARREWIAVRAFAGEEIPHPNTHLKPRALGSTKVAPAAAPELIETAWSPSIEALA
jgi:predicted RNase H-like HicB family nuclease